MKSNASLHMSMSISSTTPEKSAWKKAGQDVLKQASTVQKSSGRLKTSPLDMTCVLLGVGDLEKRSSKSRALKIAARDFSEVEADGLTLSSDFQV